MRVIPADRFAGLRAAANHLTSEELTALAAEVAITGPAADDPAPSGQTFADATMLYADAEALPLNRAELLGINTMDVGMLDIPSVYMFTSSVEMIAERNAFGSLDPEVDQSDAELRLDLLTLIRRSQLTAPITLHRGCDWPDQLLGSRFTLPTLGAATLVKDIAMLHAVVPPRWIATRWRQGDFPDDELAILMRPVDVSIWEGNRAYYRPSDIGHDQPTLLTIDLPVGAHVGRMFRDQTHDGAGFLLPPCTELQVLDRSVDALGVQHLYCRAVDQHLDDLDARIADQAERATQLL